MNRFEELIAQLNTDALLVVGGSNILYATGFRADYAYALFTKSGKYYLTDGRFTLEAKEMLSNDYIITEINTKNAFDVMISILVRDNVESISFDTDISHYQYKEIEDALSRRFKLVDENKAMLDTRMTKAQDEIDCMVIAQEIAEKSLDMLLPEIVEGMSELEVAARLEYLMRINGSDGYSFSSIVAYGSHSAFAHARPSSRKLAKGDIILIDFGATYHGYCSDMTRTFVFKSVDKVVERMYEAVLDTNIQCIKAIKPGLTTYDIDNMAREILSKYDMDTLFTHSLGHGVGIDIHESPYLAPRKDPVVLREGMVVTIEPGVYIDKVGGIRIEDMVMITKDGAVNLTKQNKMLTIIGEERYHN